MTNYEYLSYLFTNVIGKEGLEMWLLGKYSHVIFMRSKDQDCRRDLTGWHWAAPDYSSNSAMEILHTRSTSDVNKGKGQFCLKQKMSEQRNASERS